MDTQKKFPRLSVNVKLSEHLPSTSSSLDLCDEIVLPNFDLRSKEEVICDIIQTQSSRRYAKAMTFPTLPAKDELSVMKKIERDFAFACKTEIDHKNYNFKIITHLHLPQPLKFQQDMDGGCLVFLMPTPFPNENYKPLDLKISTTKHRTKMVQRNFEVVNSKLPLTFTQPIPRLVFDEIGKFVNTDHLRISDYLENHITLELRDGVKCFQENPPHSASTFDFFEFFEETEERETQMILRLVAEKEREMIDITVTSPKSVGFHFSPCSNNAESLATKHPKQEKGDLSWTENHFSFPHLENCNMKKGKGNDDKIKTDKINLRKTDDKIKTDKIKMKKGLGESKKENINNDEGIEIDLKKTDNGDECKIKIDKIEMKKRLEEFKKKDSKDGIKTDKIDSRIDSGKTDNGVEIKTNKIGMKKGLKEADNGDKIKIKKGLKEFQNKTDKIAEEKGGDVEDGKIAKPQITKPKIIMKESSDKKKNIAEGGIAEAEGKIAESKITKPKPKIIMKESDDKKKNIAEGAEGGIAEAEGKIAEPKIIKPKIMKESDVKKKNIAEGAEGGIAEVEGKIVEPKIVKPKIKKEKEMEMEIDFKEEDFENNEQQQDDYVSASEDNTDLSSLSENSSENSENSDHITEKIITEKITTPETTADGKSSELDFLVTDFSQLPSPKFKRTKRAVSESEVGRDMKCLTLTPTNGTSSMSSIEIKCEDKNQIKMNEEDEEDNKLVKQEEEENKGKKKIVKKKIKDTNKEKESVDVEGKRENENPEKPEELEKEKKKYFEENLRSVLNLKPRPVLKITGVYTYKIIH